MGRRYTPRAMSVRVGLIGCGAWGEKILRVLVASARAEVVAVADPDPARLARSRAIAPRARRARAFDEALGARVDAVVIATPPASHAELVLRALEAGADVLVEKPLAITAADAERCAARAAALGRIGMVGHLLRYHPAVARLVELAQGGELGELVAFAATRSSARAAVDARSTLWALGPHDLAVLGALDASPADEIEASEERGGVLIEARLESGTRARVALRRTCTASAASAAAVKERWTRVVGARRAAWFDEVRAPDRILVGTPRGRARSAEGPLGVDREIRIEGADALAIEMEHFLRCVEERAEPLTPLSEGAAVVRALGRAEAALGERAERVAVGR